ncbi:MAG: GNAT family N-acetyltransferase, partial [Bacillota bacterium]
MQNKQENLTIEDFRFQKAGKRYEEQMRRLWAECFPEDRDSGFIPFFFEQIYDEERTYLALYDNKVCSMVYAPLMKYHFGGVDFTAAYIQGVATVPEFRNLHLANTLLRRALDDLNRQGVPFGILKPFNVGFYEKSGWRVFSRMAEVPLEAVDIPNEYSDCSATGDSGKSADVLMLSRQKKESAARGFLKNLKKFWREKRQTVSSERMDCILAASADVGTGEKFSSNSVKSGENLQLAEIKNYEEYLTDLAAVFEYWQRNSHNAYPLRDSRGWSLLLRDHFNDGGRLFAAFYRDKMLAYCLYLEQ